MSTRKDNLNRQEYIVHLQPNSDKTPMPEVNDKRTKVIRHGREITGPVIYAMSRDQRVNDNWALLYARQLAVERKQPLIVACPIAADYPDAPGRQLDFMISGLREVAVRLFRLRIPFVASQQPAAHALHSLIESIGAGALVCDFNPLKESRSWKTRLAEITQLPIYEVDAHNIVPCREGSNKQEYAAYTIRSKIHKKLNEYLDDIPTLKKHPFPLASSDFSEEWSTIDEIISDRAIDNTGAPYKPGEAAAQKQLRLFLSKKLIGYNTLRNNPAVAGQSDLSPYLHFGQLSAQRAAFEAQKYDTDIASQEAFLEELIVRRELADNFCFYNDSYDSITGFPQWAQKTLNEHRRDLRLRLYDRDELENAVTHDELWNAAQIEMVITGKMHGYMRMYWAKKILEWSPSPRDALSHAIYLNNKYELDGHDPNGYAGIAWSIGGVHDRAWSEREIFGKIRYMSYTGCRRKFPVDDYVNRIAALAEKVMA